MEEHGSGCPGWQSKACVLQLPGRFRSLRLGLLLPHSFVVLRGCTSMGQIALITLAVLFTRIRSSVPYLISLLVHIGCPHHQCALALQQGLVCWPWHASCRHAPDR